jgi:hypothetical protein
MSTANALTKVEDNVDTLLQKLEGQWRPHRYPPEKKYHKKNY